MEGRGNDLERTSHVHEVEVRLQGEQDVDRLVRHCRPLRSHRDDFKDMFRNVPEVFNVLTLLY